MKDCAFLSDAIAKTRSPMVDLASKYGRGEEANRGEEACTSGDSKIPDYICMVIFEVTFSKPHYFTCIM